MAAMSQPSPTIQELVDRTVDRFLTLFETYDTVAVGFSGGKDSTCMMECGAIAAAQAGVPLQVQFFDEEVIPATTVAYIGRLAERTDIDLQWHCLPITEGNAWSREYPHWWPWAPEAEPLWVRSMPEDAITSVPGYDPSKVENRVSLEFLKHFIARAELPRTRVDCIGRRAAESPARRSMAKRMGWLQPASGKRYSATASPIIDWSNYDVWRAIKERGWDWNRSYLRFYQAGLPVPALRIGPLFGEEPSGGLHAIRKTIPDIWPLACRRVPGAADLARYANSAVMGRGRMRPDADITADAISAAFEELPGHKRKSAAHSIRIQIKQALNFRTRINAKSVLKTALRGDSKGDRLLQSASTGLAIRSMDEGKYRVDLNRVDQIKRIKRRKREQEAKRVRSNRR